MLPAANRLRRGSDFTDVIRHGRRINAPGLIVHVAAASEPGSTQFGFIVGRPVGSAVHRNRVRRRLRSAAHVLLPSVTRPSRIVVRARPAARDASFRVLHEALGRALGSVRVQ